MPAGLFALGWIFLGQTDGWVGGERVCCGDRAAITVCSTAMIYASLKPIAQWHSRFTVPGYLLYSAMTALVLLNALLQVFGLPSAPGRSRRSSSTLFGWGWKLRDMAT